MATLNNELALVRRFYLLSQKYDSRPSIARRNTLPTLTRFLGSKDREIRKLSLEAIHLLAEHPENVNILGGDEKLIAAVVDIYKEAQYDDPEMCELSSETLDCLSSTFVNGDPRKEEVLRRASETGLVEPRSSLQRSTSNSPSQSPAPSGRPTARPSEFDATVSTTTTAVAAGHHEGSRSTDEGDAEMEESAYLRSARQRQGGGGGPTGPESPLSAQTRAVRSAASGVTRCPRVVVLSVPALNARSDTRELEEILQTTRGVISYTITLSLHQIKVYMSVGPQQLQEALHAAGFSSLVISDEKMQSRGHAAGGADDEGKAKKSFYDTENQRPGYLQSVRNFASSLYSSVIIYSSPENNTLAARVAKQREADAAARNPRAERLAKAFAQWW